MDISQIPPEHLKELLRLGIDPSTVELAPSEAANTPEGMSPTQAALATAKAHAGGTIGGGLAGLGGWAGGGSLALGLGLAPESMGASLLIPLIASLGASAAGSYAGQKGQEALLSKEYEAELEAKAKQAQEEHPNIALGTDIATGALASGGAFSPSTTVKGLKGLLSGTLTPEARNVALQAALNPTISAGMSVAQGNGLPSIKELAMQAAGSALFAKPSFLGMMGQRPHNPEIPQLEPDAEPLQDGKTSVSESATSPFLEKGADGNYTLSDDTIKSTSAKLYPKPTTKGDPTDPAFLQQMQQWKLNRAMPVEQLRQVLHDRLMEQQAKMEPVQEPLQTTSPIKMVDEGDTKQAATTQDILGNQENLLTQAKASQDIQEQQAKLETENALPLGDGEKAPTVEQTAQPPAEASEQNNTPPAAKVLSDNSMRIVNKGTLLPTDVARPEARPNAESDLTAEDLRELNGILKRGRTDNRSEAERIQDEMEGSGAHWSQKKEPSADLKEYQAINDALNKMHEDGSYMDAEGNFTPEYMKLLKAAKEVKNRNKVVTPVQSKSGLPSNPYKESLRIQSKYGRYTPEEVEQHGNQNHEERSTSKQEDIKSYWTAKIADSLLKADKTIPNFTEAYRQAHEVYNNFLKEGKIEGSKTHNNIKDWVDELDSYAKPNTSQEIKAARESYGVEATPEHIVEHIFSGKATTGSVIKMFAQHEGNPFQKLAQALYMHMDNESRRVKWDTGLQERSGYFSPDMNRTPDTVQMNMVDNHHAPTVMEEAIHSMTSAKLPSEWSGLKGAELLKAMERYVTRNPKHPVSELARCYIESTHVKGVYESLFKQEHTIPATKDSKEQHFAKGVAGSPDAASSKGVHYGFGDLHEFIAHAMMDKDFQHMLNGIKTEPNKPSIWKRIVNAVSHLLGVPVDQHYMLCKVLEHSGALINKKRPMQSGALDAPMYSKQNYTPHFAPAGKIKRLTQPIIDKVRELQHPEAKRLGNAFQNVLSYRQLKKGEWVNEPLRVAEEVGLTKSDRLAIAKQQNYDRTNKSYGHQLLTNKAQKATYNAMLKANDAMIKERIAINEPVIENGKPRATRAIPGYWPTMPKQDTIQTYRNATDLPAIAKLDAEFVKNRIAHGETPVQAQEALKDFKTAIQGSTKNAQVSNQQFFNANRRSHGIPLPESFREPDALRNWERYAGRSALDVAHYKHIESNPTVMSALGETHDAWRNPIPKSPNEGLANNPAVRDVLNTFHGEIGNPIDYNEHAVSHLATTLFIASPALEAHTLVSNVLAGFAADAENPYQYVRALGMGLKNLKQGYQHASEGGLTKLTARSVSDMMDGSLTAAERIQAAAKGVRHIASLGDLTNKWGAALLQGMQEAIIPSKLHRANSGDKSAQSWFKNLDPQYSVGKVYTRKEQQQLASIAASYIHGTGDARMLPGWMLKDSEMSGFFSLAHWSLSQTNRFYSNILEPAKQGNYAPLMTSLFGAAIGGYLVKEIREELSGKKSSIPSLQEIAASSKGIEGNMGLVGYNLVAAAQYSGFAGILAQIAKYPFDWSYKNMSQSATFPLDEVASDLGGTLKDVATTIVNDPNVNYLSLVQEVGKHLLTTSFQLGRMGVNQGIDHGLITGMPAEKKELSDKMGQLRRFNMVEGLPYNEIEGGSNPYMNLEQKKYKSTQDLGEAMKMLPELVSNIMERYKDTPDIMMNKLKALKENQYSTFPSIEHMPLSFIKYMGYLQRMEGPEQAQQELHNYMQHKMTNSVKAAMVP